MSWLSGILGSVGLSAGDLLPTLGSVVGTAVGGPAGGAIGGTIGKVASGAAQGVAARNALKDAQRSAEEAKAANIARYNQQIAELTGLRDRTMALNNQVSDQLETDIGRNFDDLRSSSDANLSARGLAGTTIPISINAGISRERAASLASARDARINRTNQIDTTASNELARAIAARNDVGPTAGDINGLAASAGSASATIGGGLQDLYTQIMKTGQTGPAQLGDSTNWLQKLAPGYFDNLSGGYKGLRYA